MTSGEVEFLGPEPEPEPQAPARPSNRTVGWIAAVGRTAAAALAVIALQAVHEPG